MYYKSFLIISLFFIVQGLSFASHVAKPLNSTEAPYGYYEYWPNPINKEKAMPLIISLHGGKERGNGTTSLSRVLHTGLPAIIEEGGEFPAIVISPQSDGAWDVKKLDDFIEFVFKKYPVDKNRLYITGFSMGGAGTWHYAVEYPEKVAAIIPICGATKPVSPKKLVDIPIWAFHNDGDPTVPSKLTKDWIYEIKQAGGNPKMTIYNTKGHNSWSTAYNDPELYRWLFKQINKKEDGNKSALGDKKSGSFSKNNEVGLQMISKLPISLKESSGLLISKQDSLFWSHNDSGNLPFLIGINAEGKVIKNKRIINSANFDWEDLAQDDRGNVYIGDIGNNKNNRKSLQIYKIKHPSSVAENRIPADIIEYSYIDQNAFPPAEELHNYDAEALIWMNDSLFIFTKNRTNPYTGYTRIYSLSDSPGNYKAQLKDSIKLDGGSMVETWITGADISPDGKKLVLLSSGALWVFSCFEGTNFFKGAKTRIDLGSISQKEGIAFSDNNILYITDENFIGMAGGNLYKIDISDYVPDCSPK